MNHLKCLFPSVFLFFCFSTCFYLLEFFPQLTYVKVRQYAMLGIICGHQSSHSKDAHIRCFSPNNRDGRRKEVETDDVEVIMRKSYYPSKIAPSVIGILSLRNDRL